MDVTIALTRFQAALEQQMSVAASDPAVESAGAALLAAVQPALRGLAFDLAEQAAAEVRAQLPGQSVEVVLEQGEPFLRVRAEQPSAGRTASEEGADARITLRLTPRLKEIVEAAAADHGESLNSWLVNLLSVHGDRPRARGRRVEGTIET